MSDSITAFITWTTYGTWLPGDERGWRKRNKGNQQPRPNLERWCREQMSATSIILTKAHRKGVETACREHCDFRGWNLLAISARTNHVHVVVEACETPQTMRDQLKANSTRGLRLLKSPLIAERTWTRGGDCQILNKDSDIEATIMYVTEAQDRIDREQHAANE